MEASTSELQMCAGGKPRMAPSIDYLGAEASFYANSSQQQQESGITWRKSSKLGSYSRFQINRPGKS
jgi:hypothetical protein